MPDCRYKRKKKNVLAGYFWCTVKNKVVKDCNSRCWNYRPKFPNRLFLWLKEVFKYDR